MDVNELIILCFQTDRDSGLSLSTRRCSSPNGASTNDNLDGSYMETLDEDRKQMNQSTDEYTAGLEELRRELADKEEEILELRKHVEKLRSRQTSAEEVQAMKKEMLTLKDTYKLSKQL